MLCGSIVKKIKIIINILLTGNNNVTTISHGARTCTSTWLHEAASYPIYLMLRPLCLQVHKGVGIRFRNGNFFLFLVLIYKHQQSVTYNYSEDGGVYV